MRTGARVCGGPHCTNILEPGESCEDCERERLREPGMWGPAIDKLARGQTFAQGYSPSIEFFPTKGYKVGVWPARERSPFIALGYVGTFQEAVELLLEWKP